MHVIKNPPTSPTRKNTRKNRKKISPITMRCPTRFQSPEKEEIRQRKNQSWTSLPGIETAPFMVLFAKLAQARTQLRSPSSGKSDAGETVQSDEYAGVELPDDLLAGGDHDTGTLLLPIPALGRR